MHEIVEPEGLPPARGFSHGVIAGPSRTLWVAGQISFDATGTVVGETWTEQFEGALANVVATVEAGGGSASAIVSMEIYTTDVSGYREARSTLKEPYQRVMGDHYPAMALLGVTELVEEAAIVEITAVAVLPD